MGMLMSTAIFAGSLDKLFYQPRVVSYECAVPYQGEYLADVQSNETVAINYCVDTYINAVAAGSPDNSHRWWEIAVSTVEGDFNVDEACRDISEPGDLDPRITFQPRFVNGCAQPSEPFFVNVRPVGGEAEDCGVSKDCNVLVYHNYQ